MYTVKSEALNLKPHNSFFVVFKVSEHDLNRRDMVVNVQVVKNKTAAPFKIAEFDILFDSGINTLGCMVEAAEQVGVLERRGAWYNYEGNNMAQGREKVIAKLRADDSLRE